MADILQVAGNVVQGVAGYEAGKFNKKAADASAVQAEQDGSDQEALIRERARAAMGEQLVAQGASGFQMGTGSALDALAQSQVNATLDALTIRRKAAAEARTRRVQGAIAKAQGENALVSGMIGATSAAASSRSDWAGARSGTSGNGASSAGAYSAVDYGSGYQNGVTIGSG
jgi:hypothetical protein